MSQRWYDAPMRIAALQCKYEGYDAGEVLDRWVEGGFNVEQLLHPMTDSYTAIYDEKKHGEIVREYVDQARSRGIRIILYVNVHTIPTFQKHMADQWAQREADGSFVKLYETKYAVCLNSPWSEYFMTVLDDVGSLEIDGIFLDGPLLRQCCCDHCKRRNALWYGQDAPFPADEVGFYARSRNEFLGRAYRRFKEHRPEAIFYINQPVKDLAARRSTLPEMLEYNDVLGTEGGFMFYGPPRGGSMWKPSTAAKMLEALAPAKPRVVFMAGDQKRWSWYMHTPVETELCMASSVANGANIWYGLHGGTVLLDTPGGRAATGMTRFLADNEQYYGRTTSEARIALMYSYATERFHGSDVDYSDFYGDNRAGGQSVSGNMAEAFGGFFDVLSRSSIPFDVVTDFELTAEKLKGYDLLILPTAAALADDGIAVIRSFVDGGGRLISNCETSLFSPDGSVREDFALADVFGVRFEGHFTQYPAFNYVSKCEDHALTESWQIPLIPAPAVGLDVRPVDGSTVLARFHEPQGGPYVPLSEPRLAAIVLNRFGKGSSVYLAGSFGELMSSHSPPEYRRLVESAAGNLADSPVRLEGGLGNVEMSVRRQEGRRIVHLVNYAALPPRPFENVAPQRDVRLVMNSRDGFSSARALRGGCDCAVSTQGDQTTALLPEIRTYEVVVIE